MGFRAIRSLCGSERSRLYAYWSGDSGWRGAAQRVAVSGCRLCVRCSGGDSLAGPLLSWRRRLTTQRLGPVITSLFIIGTSRTARSSALPNRSINAITGRTSSLASARTRSSTAEDFRSSSLVSNRTNRSSKSSGTYSRDRPGIAAAWIIKALPERTG